jgi:hypothetical protein
MCLLLAAIVLFALSAFFYSYQQVSNGATLNAVLGSYPYRAYGVIFVGFGSVLTFAASISYSKRSKHLEHKSYRV